MLKVKKILLEVKDENGNIMFGEFDDSKSALAEVKAIKSSDCGWKLYNVSIYLIDEEEYKQERYELYKASKLYVRSTRNYGEFGLLEVWKIVNGKRYGEEITTYFKETILEEYRNTLTEQRIKQMYDIHRVKELGITLEQYRQDFIDFYNKQIKYKVFNGTFDEFVEAGYNMQLTDF